MNNIIPGILETSWEEIEKRIQALLPFSKTIHIDLIDGKFAPKATFLDPTPFKKYTNQVKFELHMMVEEPVNYLKVWSDAGFQRFLGHIEKMSDQTEFVARGEELGEVGLALDIDTPFEKITVPQNDLDVILFLCVKAGESGQSFDEKSLERVKSAKDKIFIPIEVDGGIDSETIILAKNAGAERFVSTSFISQGNPKENYEKLINAVGPSFA